MATTAKLRIELFGELRFTVKDAVENEVMSGVTARLLAYLALHSDHETSRELLCELLWEGTPESARQSLRQALHDLRKHIEPAPIEKGSLLITTRNGVRLNPLALSTDVTEFEGIIAQTTHTTSIEERAALFASALALVKGVFMPGYYDEWIVAEQTRLTSDYDYACLEYLRILEVLERTDETVTLANQILASNPCHEEVHCTLMRVYAARGHTKLVQRQVEKLWKCLEADGMGTPRIATDAYIESLLQQARLVAPTSKPPLSSEPSTPESKPIPRTPTLSAPSTKWRKEWAFLLLPFVLFLFWNKTSAPKHPDPKSTPPDKQVANALFTAQPSLSATQPPPPKKIEPHNGSTPKRSDDSKVEVQPVGQIAKRREDRPSPPKTKLPESLIPVPAPVTEERRPLWIARFVNETGDIDSRSSVVKTDGQGNIYVGGFVKNRVFDEYRKHDVEQVDFIVL
ncbi:MAG: BTAD domain-containing putative transcriptional regulator, partial [Armatimonadetes bacterium]|nr:BTAD domain-containing putative transcriptional regulator [Armatimonadota bacterium]